MKLVSLRFLNEGDEPIVFFPKGRNQPNLHDVETLLEDIQSREHILLGRGPSLEETAIALYRFVIEQTTSGPPPLQGLENWRFPDLYTVYGYSECGELASGLVSLWKAAGFHARLWCLGGHIAPEVCWEEPCDSITGSWHMLDPYYSAYFRHTVDGHILSVEEVASNPRIVLDYADQDDESLSGSSLDELVDIVAPPNNWCDEPLDFFSPAPDISLPPGASLALFPYGFGTRVCIGCQGAPDGAGTAVVTLPFQTRMEWNSSYPIDRVFLDLENVILSGPEVGRIGLDLSLTGTINGELRTWTGSQTVEIAENHHKLSIDLSSAFDDEVTGPVTTLALEFRMDQMEADPECKAFLQFAPRLIQISEDDRFLQILGRADDAKLEIEVETYLGRTEADPHRSIIRPSSLTVPANGTNLGRLGLQIRQSTGALAEGAPWQFICQGLPDVEILYSGNHGFFSKESLAFSSYLPFNRVRGWDDSLEIPVYLRSRAPGVASCSLFSGQTLLDTASVRFR